MDHNGRNETRPMGHDDAAPQQQHQGHMRPTSHHGEGAAGVSGHGAGSAHSGQWSHGASADHAGATGHGGQARMPHHDAESGSPQQPRNANFPGVLQQFTMATGYIGLGLLAITLLLGPANLVLRRRNPVSTYLRRDVGIWTAAFSLVHVFAAVLIHNHGGGFVSSFLSFFISQEGAPLTNSFGWGNWTGLAATIVAVVLLVTSNDAALRVLKAKRWKWMQRLNYALIALVVLHAFFYGAFLRITSPFTWVLILSVAAVALGQSWGVFLWRRRNPSLAAS